MILINLSLKTPIGNWAVGYLQNKEALGLQFYGIKRIVTYLPDDHHFTVITELHDEYNGGPIVDTVAADDQLVAELKNKSIGAYAKIRGKIVTLTEEEMLTWVTDGEEWEADLQELKG